MWPGAAGLSPRGSRPARLWGQGECTGQSVRGQCRGSPGCTGTVPREGALSLQAPPALTLQQVGDEQRRALVTAGQPPLGQVLLDLEGEEVPVEGHRSMPWGELGAGLSHEGRAVPISQPMGRTSAESQDELQPLQLGTAVASTSLPLKCSLVDFKINIPFCFGGHLPLLGLTFCKSTVLFYS